ncbi:MAG: hypothetical protein CMQ58_01085 [Gammaproteobacteria bacterium]|nr:hypothetical protein [Gammaproteobacteria bacterium]
MKSTKQIELGYGVPDGLYVPKVAQSNVNCTINKPYIIYQKDFDFFKSNIRKWCTKINSSMSHVYKHADLVIGNGSTHIYTVLIRGLYNLLKRPIRLFLEQPYWFVAQVLKKEDPQIKYITDPNADIDLEIRCTPNNPDGTEYIEPRTNAKYLLYDFAYNMTIYTDKPVTINQKKNKTYIYTGTVSKIGVPSSRFGWGFVDGPHSSELAKFMQTEVIITVGGGNVAWYSANNYLNYLLNNEKHFKKLMSTNNKILNNNKKIMMKALEPYKFISIEKPSDHKGGYLWVKTSKNSNLANWFLNKFNVVVKNGKSFGANQQLVRINMMAKTSDIREVARRMRKKFTIKKKIKFNKTRKSK